MVQSGRIYGWQDYETQFGCVPGLLVQIFINRISLYPNG